MSACKDLKTERYWIYEAEVKGTYMPENILKINDFELKAIEHKMEDTIFIATLKIKVEDIDISARIADEKFAEIFNALSLVTGGSYEYNKKAGVAFPRFDEKGKPSAIIYGHFQLPFSHIMGDEQTKKVSKEAKQLIPLSQIDDKVFQKAFEYFILGTKISKWSNESFLNFFKAIELISDHFYKKFENNIKQKIPDLTKKEVKEIATRKRLIINACDILNVENIEKTEIKKIVRIRNEYDVAHSKLYIVFEKEYVELCNKIAREILLKYLKYKSCT